MTTLAGNQPKLRSLGSRLTLMFLAVCAIAVTLTAGANIISQITSLHSATDEKLHALAAVVAQNARAPLLFADPEAAANTLQGLAAVPGIVRASIIDGTGNSFATFERGSPTRDTNSNSLLQMDSPVIMQGEILGSVHLHYDLAELRATIWRSGGIATVAALASLALALLLSHNLQQRISAPITRLSSTMHNVAQSQDYNLQVAHSSQDEIGELYRVFNIMLKEIKAREARLEDYRQHLQDKVHSRTLALEHSNNSLTRAKDDAERANKAKGEFIATMSHEIRTPLNGVLSLLDLVSQSPADPRQAHLLHLMRSSGDNLLAVVNDILDFSKLDARKLVLQPQPVALLDVLEHLQRSVWHQARAKGLALVLELPLARNWLLTLDETRLRQVLLNLLGNAVKFTASGQISLTVTVTPLPDGQAELAVAVRDTGIGIAADRIKDVLNAFTQADGSTARQFGGTGLGLSISNQLLGLMASRLEISSTPGEGSCFSFRLQVPAAEAEEPVNPDWLENFRGKSVLLLGTDIQTRQALQAQLNHWRIASCAVAGLAEISQLDQRQQPVFDLIVTDKPPDVALWQAVSTLQDRVPAVVLLADINPLDNSLPGTLDPGLPVLRLPMERRQFARCLAWALGDRDAAGAAAGAPEPKVPAMAAAAASAALPAQTAVPALAPPPQLGLHVLVVDDGEVNRIAAEGLLSSMGCQVDLADDGHAAVQACAQQRYDVVLMDISMPGMDGFETTAAIVAAHAAANPPRQPPPIVAVTAHADPAYAERCSAAGMAGFLSKPFVGKDLVVALEQVLPSGRAANSSGQSANTVLDDQVIQGALAAIPGGVPGMAARLVAAFHQEAATRSASYRAAALAGDSDTCRREAHGLKSAAGSVGLVQLAALCQLLEDKAAQDSSGGLAASCQLLSATLDRASASLEQTWPQGARQPPTHQL